MVCREAQIGSAATSYVLQTTSLQEQQVLSLYHEVMREGRSAPTPHDTQANATINQLASLVQAQSSLSDARRRSLLSRVERARNEPMNGQRYYATSRLIERANRAEQALNTYVASTARDLGVTEDEVRRRMTDYRDAAQRDRTLRPSDGWVAQTRSSPDYTGVPLDRQTAYAIEQLNTARAERRAQQPTRSTVVREEIFGSRAIHEMGYDPATGRVEVVLHSNPEVTYAYRMSEVDYNRFRRASSLGSYYATQVRGNDQYRYADSESADAAGIQTQCASCGQFAGTDHACPPQGSTEEINRTTRRARTAARRRVIVPSEVTPDETPVPSRRTIRRVLTSDDANEVEGVREPSTPSRTEPTRLSGPTRRYEGASGSFRTIPLGNVQHAARQYGLLSIPVNASISRIAGEGVDGVQTLGATSTVSGTMTVQYHGRAYNLRGRRFTAEAATSPGDSGNDQLRCTCADYRRNYDCVHIRQAVQDVNNRLNQDSLRTPHGIGEAIEQVNAELAQDRAESIAAQAVSREGDVASPVSYTDDPAAFQADYKAAKDRKAAGEAPVPYMTENATGGLGARGTGRAFGVELEFDVGPGVDRATMMRNIGRQLHAAGLTRSASQQGYHSAEYRGYTEEHQGGWSFENDCTVAGEIVSPIMYDTPETWENLQKVCDIIKNNGGVVTNRTGSHVHVSAHNYDHTVENHNRLLGAFAENEDTIYRLSSNPDRGTHRGPQWCAPNRVPSSGYSSISDARYRNNSHGLGLNMQSVAGEQSDHVEFRTYDATLDPSVIQTHIKMSLAITESAFRDRDYQPGTHTPLGSHRAHNRQAHGASRRLTGEAWQQDTAGYRAFADRLFRRPEDKAQLTALFAMTKWQRGGSR
jgi:hypothetical protein